MSYIPEITINGRVFKNVPFEQLSEMDASDEVINDAKSLIRSSLIKDECRRRIYAAASAETQMNMATAAAVISAKEASTRTEDEASILSGLDDAIGWVALMRGRVMELKDDATLDIHDDANWPPLPDGARDVVAKF
ncbi:hypothetical protein HGG67_05605 [Rhodobacteraceae bacterium R_SAG8]|nr:hypothetical protein [Rhodobacteraceae bacterium R_SAG8]